MINNHEISKGNTNRNYDSQIINAWKYGFDGSSEISSGGLTYLLASMLDKKNHNLCNHRDCNVGERSKTKVIRKHW